MFDKNGNLRCPCGLIIESCGLRMEMLCQGYMPELVRLIRASRGVESGRWLVSLVIFPAHNWLTRMPLYRRIVGRNEERVESVHQ